MSRGPGTVQRYLAELICGSDKPMTFADILACAYPEGSYEGDMAKELGQVNVGRVRSLRRALKSLVDDEFLIAIGEGGRGDPKRFWINPMLIALSGSSSKEDFDRTAAILKAEPGGTAAANKAWARMTKPDTTG
jgi:hypothetical protein